MNTSNTGRISEIQRAQIKADLLDLIDFIEREKELSLNDISEEFVEIIEKNFINEQNKPHI